MNWLKEKCSAYEKCSAPFCPLDEQSLKNSTWYPDEDICTSRDYKNLPWIGAQRKIAKVKSDVNKYYKFEMLNRGGMIKRGIVGLDPDQPEELQLARWMKAHPIREKRTLTEEQKRAKAEILFEARKKRSVG